MAQQIVKKNSMEKHGPYGCKDGKQWKMMLDSFEIISQIIVKSGSVIDSIAFTTAKPSSCGCKWSATHRRFGGPGGSHTNKITLLCGEYITRISGEIGNWNDQRVIAKLTIHTNLCPDGYGPYGDGKGANNLSNFSTPTPSGGRVVAFFGTHNNYLMSIGIYGKKKLKVKDGPYGSELAENWDMKIEECEFVKEIILRHGSVVYAIGFEIAKPCGLVTSNVFGGNTGVESKISLKHGEYITHLSGVYGDYGYRIKQRTLALLKIHTNLCPTGYGPFGTGNEVTNIGIFLSPSLPSNHRIVGFFGRQGKCLESIGTLLEQA